MFLKNHNLSPVMSLKSLTKERLISLINYCQLQKASHLLKTAAHGNHEVVKLELIENIRKSDDSDLWITIADSTIVNWTKALEKEAFNLAKKRQRQLRSSTGIEQL